MDNQTISVAQGDRLLQLLVKGLLYQSCVEYCQARATNTEEAIDLNDPNSLLSTTCLLDTDVSLLSWLHALPTETFSCPFEQKALSMKIEKLQKPILKVTWAQYVLSTPFKPQTIFPFNTTPTSKPRSTELMSRSSAPQYDGLSYGLICSQIFADYDRNFVNDLRRSLAICNLKDNGPTSDGSILSTVEEVLYEETAAAPSPRPIRTLSPAVNIISFHLSHRAPSLKRTPTQNSNHNIPSSTSTDTLGYQQHFPSPTSTTKKSPSQTTHPPIQTNATLVNENGSRYQVILKQHQSNKAIWIFD